MRSVSPTSIQILTVLFTGLMAVMTPWNPFHVHEYTAAELAERLGQGDPIHLIDVSEPHDLEISRLDGAQIIPLGQLASRLPELNSAEEIIVFCKSGVRSERALEILAGAGFRKLHHLLGGINAWARDVDPSLPIY